MAVQATELRPGNFIYEVRDTPENPAAKELFKVAAVNGLYNTVTDYNDNITSLEYCEPIPLAPEILEQWCGFAINTWESHQLLINKDYSLYIVVDIQSRENMVYEVTPHDGISIKFTPFLHQLQNLYFAITGEELQIKQHTINSN